MEVLLGMPFLSFSNADIKFDTKSLTWRSYTTVEILPTISRIKFINKKKFAKATLDKNFETFVVYIVALAATDGMKVYPSQASQLVVS